MDATLRTTLLAGLRECPAVITLGPLDQLVHQHLEDDRLPAGAAF